MTTPSSWAVLRQPLFRSLWAGGFAANLAIWLQTVGAAWLMTQMTSSPLLIALVQTAWTLPGVMFGLVGGALADILDRRRIMVAMLSGMALTTGLLGMLGHMESLSPWMLLLFVLVLGTGFALYLPAYMSVGADVVPVADVPAAASLTSVAFNVARVLGPAIGGVVVAVHGGSAVFAVATLCYLGTLIFLLRWKPVARERRLPPERLLGAMSTAIRYLRHTREFQKQLMHGVVFMTAGSAIWALLPVLAGKQLGLSAGGYGLLLGCLGAGGAIGALAADSLRHRFSGSGVVIVSNVVFAITCLIMARAVDVAVFCAVLVVAGAAWVTTVSTINVGIQVSRPPPPWPGRNSISGTPTSPHRSPGASAAPW